MNWHPRESGEGTRHLDRLTLHYMEYLEAVDDETFVQLVNDWIAQNPPYRPGYWLDNWNSYALSIRCLVWMQQYAIRPGLRSPEFSRQLLGSLAAQLRFLVRNLETDIGGNHLLKNLKVLLWAARFFESDEVRAYGRKAERMLVEQLREQVLADGFHFERSPAYHCQVFADLLECHACLGPGEARRELERLLPAMAQALADTTHPDGLVSLFNDGGLNMAYAPADCLAACRALTGCAAAPRAQFALPEAGYYGVRDGGNLVIVDCGIVGPDSLPAHAHGDIFSFEWTVSGRRLIVDAGVFEYHPGEWRAYSRATSSHNTVTVGGEDQCEFWKAFRVGRRARVTRESYAPGASGFSLAASHDGYRRLPGRPIHRRHFNVAPDRIEVKDTVEGGAGQPAEARLLLHPDVEVIREDGRAVLRLAEVRASLETAASVEAADAWWCPDFGVRIPAKQLILSYGPAPCECGFVLSQLA